MKRSYTIEHVIAEVEKFNTKYNESLTCTTQGGICFIHHTDESPYKVGVIRVELFGHAKWNEDGTLNHYDYYVDNCGNLSIKLRNVFTTYLDDMATKKTTKLYAEAQAVCGSEDSVVWYEKCTNHTDKCFVMKRNGEAYFLPKSLVKKVNIYYLVIPTWLANKNGLNI